MNRERNDQRRKRSVALRSSFRGLVFSFSLHSCERQGVCPVLQEEEQEWKKT